MQYAVIKNIQLIRRRQSESSYLGTCGTGRFQKFVPLCPHPLDGPRYERRPTKLGNLLGRPGGSATSAMAGAGKFVPSYLGAAAVLCLRYEAKVRVNRKNSQAFLRNWCASHPRSRKIRIFVP